jgi:hypothetical protein
VLSFLRTLVLSCETRGEVRKKGRGEEERERRGVKGEARSEGRGEE